MATTLTAEKQEYEAIPTGEYLAEFTDFEEEDGQYGRQIKLTWEIVKPKKYEGKTRFDWCNKKLSKGSKASKLWQRLEALMNRPLKIGEEVVLENLIGRQAVLAIVEETKEDGSSNSKIANVKAYGKQEPFVATESKPKSKAKADDDEFEVGEPEGDDEDPFAEE